MAASKNSALHRAIAESGLVGVAPICCRGEKIPDVYHKVSIAKSIAIRKKLAILILALHTPVSHGEENCPHAGNLKKAERENVA
jgi:hypothetical protein